MPRHATALVAAFLAGAACFGGMAHAAPATPDASAKPAPEAAKPEDPKPGKPEPVILANHKAVYDLSLASTGGTRAVESARGRIVIEFKGDSCRGYTMQTRQVTVLESGESGSRTSDLRNTTFEGGEARDFRFRTVTVLNGQPSPAVDGTADASGDAFKVRLKEPKKDQFTAAGPVLFPSLHMRRLVQAARAGDTTMSAKVFDGSDDGRKVYDTLAVIGRRATAPANAAASDRDKPLHEGAMAAVPHWPVTLSYFTQGEGERTPIYTLTFDLYENGVSGALKLDYGDFAILGDMTRLELDKAPDKPCAP
ncbi:cell envelope integrity EipB family protein [Methylobacterium sp. J-059]|uniref:cell envelope integrity EipB family protein n=2 Tax=unclassified Methylobacterium TaxID=2615210 RepID=UPI001FB8A9EA|nr:MULTISPECIES: cell envelope integrity EipB family protein [unclassified Methylobacterium]MCJ2005815.1 cell envelope integrity EipB family protein [Methylobacterium sp. J-092]MCJ2038101.1 cell envelope integrity EipB family protein [Methylobacterium sp. J-059]